MKIPKRLEPLLEDGIIDHVIKPLRSGKEADVFVVVASDEVRCAKIYKEKTNRSFHNQVLYQEGRQTKNSRSSRAMGKHTRYGKQVEEEEWQNAEVDTLFKLHGAGVCVPIPYICISGVLVMELLLDQDGQVAPRIGDMDFDPEEARYCHDYLLREVIRMLLAGIVHADLSEFNVVMTYNGPVIIDFPQAVDATSNNNAQFFLERDVKNLTHFFGKYEPEILAGNYGLEIWQHYSAGTLTPELELTGKPTISSDDVNLGSIFREIEEAREEAERKAIKLSGIEPEESNEMCEWYEPQRKKRTFTEPQVEASPTSPSRFDKPSQKPRNNDGFKKKNNGNGSKPTNDQRKPTEQQPIQRKSETAAFQKRVEAPGIQRKVETPNIQPRIETPSIQRKVETPSFQPRIETPAVTKKVETPAPTIQWGRR